MVLQLKIRQIQRAVKNGTLISRKAIGYQIGYHFPCLRLGLLVSEFCGKVGRNLAKRP